MDDVQEYQAAIEAGADMTPMVVFFDGSIYWLSSGFHRRKGYELANIVEVPVDVREGSKRDAWLFAKGDNKHGKRYTGEEKRRNVRDMLEDSETTEWSNNRIALHIGVTPPLVANLRRELPQNESSPINGLHLTGNKVSTRTGLDGKKYPVNQPAPAPHPDEYFTDGEAPDDEPLGDDDTGITDDEISEAYTVPAIKQAKAKQSDEAPPTAAALPDDDLTDDEYLKRCPAYRRLMQFAHKGTEFKKNALAYRAMSESVPGKATLLGQVKHSVGRHFETAATGPFYDVAARFANTKHPSEWPLCVKCQGKLVVFADTADHTGAGPEIICKRCTGGYTL